MSWCYRLLILLLYLYTSQLYSADEFELRFEQISRAEGLSQSTVNCFLMDRNGFIWIGTCVGLNRYDGYNFKIYDPEPGNPNSLSHVFVESLYGNPSDTCHVLWIGTQGISTVFKSIKNKILTHYRSDSEKSSSIGGDIVYEICPDRDGYLWITSWDGGLIRFDLKQKTFKNYRHDPLNSNSLSSNQTNPIIRDHRGYLWIGTEGGGIKYFPSI